MVSYRTEILTSWVGSEPSSRALAQLLGMTTPTTLRDIVNRLRQVETIDLPSDINTPDDAAIRGHVSMKLQSNGHFVFSGYVKATAIASYHFGLQAWVDAAGSSPVAATQSGRVFGDDSPGPDTYSWNEPGDNAGIKAAWRTLRAGPVLHLRFKADISGLLGAAVDVLEFAIKGIAMNAVLGPAGWYLLIGNELAGASNDLASPDIDAGILVGAGVLLVVGPFGLIPAVAAGAATVAIADVKHHSMKADEIAFARRVFADSLPYDRLVLTNMQRPDNGAKFTWPGVGNKILVNLGPAYDNPIEYADPTTSYPQKGQVFIHELTHAWQIFNLGLPRVICHLSTTYTYADDPTWATRAFSSFNDEQQATIVDNWYANHRNDAGWPNSAGALADPAFHFIRDNIWPGLG
jgi:hypothetical protein